METQMDEMIQSAKKELEEVVGEGAGSKHDQRVAVRQEKREKLKELKKEKKMEKKEHKKMFRRRQRTKSADGSKVNTPATMLMDAVPFATTTTAESLVSTTKNIPKITPKRGAVAFVEASRRIERVERSMFRHCPLQTSDNVVCTRGNLDGTVCQRNSSLKKLMFYRVGKLARMFELYRGNILTRCQLLCTALIG